MRFQTAIVLGFAVCGLAHAGELERDFSIPPHEAKPWIYYTFMNGWADSAIMAREVKDLRKMGMGGVMHLQNKNLSGPISGPEMTKRVIMLSPEWDQWFGEMLGLAHEAGLTLSATICDGHGLGGPWVKAEAGLLGPVRVMAVE